MFTTAASFMKILFVLFSVLYLTVKIFGLPFWVSRVYSLKKLGRRTPNF